MKPLRLLTTATLFAGLLGGALFAASPLPKETGAPKWKTAFYKRGFVGLYQAKWAGGEAGVGLVRLPLVIPFDGTKVRVWMSSGRDQDIVLGRMSLALGMDREGGTDGTFAPITFGGAPGVTIAAKQKDFVSDEVSMPIHAGQWYLQQNYTSEKYLYAYDADGFFRVATDDQKKPASPDDFRKGSWTGNVYRIDVFTGDPRPLIVCYGDSITQGAGSTPKSGNRYPALLGGLIDSPVLNLGVNGDLAKYAKGIPSITARLDGVETVVFLMGINDIISGSLKTADDYIKTVEATIVSIHKSGSRFYIGTITPAGGYAKFDADPAKEALRQEINTWIRGQKTADGVIDFDAALRDPKTPERLKAEYQSDWLHPSDAGYSEMAQAAAEVLRVKTKR